MTKDITRRCRFTPYLAGKGPRFTLTMWDTSRTGSDGKSILGYQLKQDGVELFTGEDFACSPMHCVDSDNAVAALMGFLTLRKGDTDADYFKDYTPAQVEFSEQHAEALSWYVTGRFGEL